MALTTLETGGQRAAEQVRKDITRGGRDIRGGLFQLSLLSAMILALAVLVALLLDVWGDASTVIPDRLGSFLEGQYTSRAASAGIANAIRGTFWIGVFTVASFPLGIAAALYLEEYAPRSWLTSLVNINIRNLAGVPSVVYGIFGLTVLVGTFGDFTGGKTPISAGITIAVLVLPIVIITAAEAVRAVPSSLREGGFGLGATRWEVIRTQVLPYAAPGILTGTVLAFARALGEAAPLLVVGAVGTRLSDDHSLLDLEQLHDPFVALPTVITDWAKRPLNSGFFELSAAAIVVVLVVVLLANTFAIILRNRFEKKRAG